MLGVFKLSVGLAGIGALTLAASRPGMPGGDAPSKLERAAQSAIDGDLPDERIAVKVSGLTATLSGSVASESRRKRAQETVKAVRGVHEVHNRLTLAAEPASTAGTRETREAAPKSIALVRLPKRVGIEDDLDPTKNGIQTAVSIEHSGFPPGSVVSLSLDSGAVLASEPLESDSRSAPATQEFSVTLPECAPCRIVAASGEGLRSEVGTIEGRETEGSRLEREIAAVVSKQRINFRRGGAQLTAKAQRVVAQVAEILLSAPAASCEIHGHTDSTGQGDPNRQLSLARADAVRDALVQRGISKERLRSRGFGAERPIADNASAKGRAMNRRIEFVLP